MSDTMKAEGMEPEVMEIARFRFVDGDAEAAARAAAGVSAWLQAQPGFRSRVLVGPDDEGAYTDLVRWRSAADAHAAMAAMEQSEVAMAFMAQIDPASVQLRHAPVRAG
jgi:heme-degrading monooxygenase HmoA